MHKQNKKKQDPSDPEAAELLEDVAAAFMATGALSFLFFRACTYLHM